MSLLAAHADWLARLRAGADRPPLRPRVPLWWRDTAIGTVEPGLPDQIRLQPAPVLREAHQALEARKTTGCTILTL